LECVDRTLEFVGRGDGGRDPGLPVEIEGRLVESDLNLLDGTGSVPASQ